MVDAYRGGSRIEPGIQVRVANPRVGVIVGPSPHRKQGWFVEWPNGLVTTEIEGELVRSGPEPCVVAGDASEEGT